MFNITKSVSIKEDCSFRFIRFFISVFLLYRSSTITLGKYSGKGRCRRNQLSYSNYTDMSSVRFPKVSTSFPFVFPLLLSCCQNIITHFLFCQPTNRTLPVFVDLFKFAGMYLCILDKTGRTPGLTSYRLFALIQNRHAFADRNSQRAGSDMTGNTQR